MSVEGPLPGDGLPYKVRWREDVGGRRVNHARRFATRKAAEKFDRTVKDLKAAGELHRLDEAPRGTITLHDYTWDVWWPEYAEVNLSPATRDNYAIQLDLRILPQWGRHELRAIRPGAIEAWIGRMRKAGVKDPTILHTLAVFSAIMKRAERDEEIPNPLRQGVAKPRRSVSRAPDPVSPYLVERMCALLRDPPERQDKRGRRIARRDPIVCEMDAVLVELLAYAGPRPESEALPLTWPQIGRRTITFRATKSGKVVERETRLLEPLARDLRRWRLRCPPTEGGLVFPGYTGGIWTGEDWDNWRDRIYRPAARAAGLPKDTRPRDLRGSFVSLMVFEGVNVVELAPELGHSAETCWKYYARVFKEFDAARRRPAVDVIREAREAVAAGRVPTGYPAADESAGGVR